MEVVLNMLTEAYVRRVNARCGYDPYDTSDRFFAAYFSAAWELGIGEPGQLVT